MEKPLLSHSEPDRATTAPTALRSGTGEQPIHKFLIGAIGVLGRGRDEASTSASDGGRPVRSRETRRDQRLGTRQREGASPSDLSRSVMKKSIGCSPAGTTGFFGSSKTSAAEYPAPCSIQRFRRASCFALSRGCSSRRGITSSGSFEVIRRQTSDSSIFPGTIRSRRPIRSGAFEGVQPQPRLPMLGVETVTGEAVL